MSNMSQNGSIYVPRTTANSEYSKAVLIATVVLRLTSFKDISGKTRFTDSPSPF